MTVGNCSSDESLTLWIEQRRDAQVLFCRRERVGQVLSVRASRQLLQVHQVLPHAVDHGVEGVAIAETPPKVTHFDTVLPVNKKKQ